MSGLFEALQGEYIAAVKAAFPPGTHNRAKLTSEEVDEIRDLYAQGYMLQKELAREFGISQPEVSRIVNKKRWK